MATDPEVGLLLLTGGEGRRFGAPKHRQPHPEGGSWAGHLVRVFEAVCPAGPLQILGEAVPERPQLPRLDDPRQGPAVALAAWAATPPPPARRWWVVACDQIRWQPEALRDWLDRAGAADPEGEAWVLARVEDRLQFLGGVLGAGLLPEVARGGCRSLWALADILPRIELPDAGRGWADIDRPEDLA